MLDKELLDQEMEKKITEMEQADYVFPKRFSREDYIFAIVVILVSLGSTIAGVLL